MAQHKVKEFILSHLGLRDGQLTFTESGAAAIRAELTRLSQTPDAIPAGVVVLDLIGLLKVAGRCTAASELTRILSEIVNQALGREHPFKFAAFAGADPAHARAPGVEDKVPEGAGKRTQALPSVAFKVRG
jgi:hypothetical protein